MQSPKVTLSPVNGVSKRIGYGVSSTPLPSSTPHAQNALFSPSRISPLRHPPRYFLSNASPTRSPVTPVKSARAVVVQNSSGPLLASTRFNVNLGTYTDSRSPGLSSRIVQYDNEAKEKLAPTHQAKYGSPGVFPVVHFFKKEIPVISPKAKRVTVRLASPDGNFYSTSKYSRCLSNEALSEIRNGEVRRANTSTKSVLDALKEISRKRIHTSTDFETNQEGPKRQRVDCTNGAYENNKRAREESPPVQELTNATTAAVSSQSASKKICVVDVLAASYTSSNLLKEQLEKGLKRQTELEEESQKSKQKEMKLINAETQTQNVEEAPKLTKKLLEEINTTGKLDKPDAAAAGESEKKEEVQGSPARFANVFDEKRLEVNRKNKLATLLSAITGEPPKLISHDGEQKEGHKLTSILSPQNKPKHDKHVSFNLPPEESEPEKKEEEVAREPVKSDAAPPVVEPAKSNLNSTGEVSNLVATGTVNSIMQVTNALPDTVVSSAASIGEFNPQVTADAATSANLKVVDVNPSVASPSTPVGGFKYDLGKIASSSSNVATPGFSFGVTQSKLISPTNQGGSEGKTSETFNFGSKLPAFGAAPSISSPSSLGNAITPATSTVIPMLRSPTSAATTSTSPFSINFGGASSSSSTTSFTTSAATTLTVSFPAMTSTPKFSTVTTTSTPMFGGTPTTSTVAFGNAPPTTAAFNFGTTTTSSSAAPNFGMTVSPNFGTASTSVTSPNFGTASSVPPPNFGVTTPSAAFNFGTAVTSVAAPNFGATPTSGSGFGVAPTSSTAMFGIKSSISPPMFGTTLSASPPMFGTTPSTSAPTFGGSALTTSAPMFGTTTSSATPMFGTTTSSATPMFGTTTSSATPMFGTTSSTPVFGGGIPSTSAPAFGTATISAFNSVPNFASGFNSRGNFNTTTVATTTAPFMSATISTPTFTNSAITFGTPATTFGTSDNTMFVSQASSGGGITKPPAFGFSSAPSLPFRTNLTTSAPLFGTNQVTSAPSNFRTNPVVTSAPPFGTNPVTSIPPPSFGTPAPPSFGTNLITSTSTSTPMFGANPNNSSVVPFGSSTAPSGFGTFNSAAPPAAFSTPPVTTSSSGFTTSKPFNFVGSNTAFATQPNPTTSFNFTAPTASTSIFNTPKTTHSFTSGFGSNPNQNVGFGSPTSPPNPFGQAPNAFPFQASPNVAPFDANKNATAFNNSFNSFGGNAAAVPNQMFVSGEPQNVGFNSPAFQFNNSAAPANNTNAQGAGIFTFGSNNQQQQPTAPSSGVFTFGSGDTQKPNFNFSGGSNLPTSAAAFGGNAPPGSFVNNFGSSPAGMFSIGSGSSTTNRSRMQFKVKKRN